jgi:DNA repair exonuclease SbcCD ATPase subunit
MAQSIRFELLGESSDLQKAFSEGVSSAEAMEGALGGLEESVESLLQGQVELNQAAGRFTDEGGNFISTTEAQERALQDLNEVGVQSTKQVREQVERLEALEEIYEGDAKAASELSERQQRLRTELAEVGEAAAQQNRDLSRLDQQFGSSTVRMGNFAEQQEQLQRELRETASAQRQFGSASGSADQAVTALSRGLEDVAFARDFGDAMRFAGNNVTQAAQSFDRARVGAGGLTAALSTITPATIGVAAFSALVALGPRVVDFFSDAEEGAESFEDRVDKATDSVFRLRDATQDPIRLGLEQARQSVELLSDDLNEVREIRERLLSPSSPEFAAAAGAVGTPSGSKLKPRPTEALEALRERETISENTQNRLDEIIQQREDLNTLLRVQRRTLAEGSEITKAQVRQIQEGTASTEALVTASEEGVVRFERLSGLADDLLGRYQSVTQLLQGQNRLVDENLVKQGQITDELASRLEDAENIEQVQERLNTAVEDGLITQEQMQAVMENIRSDTEDTSEEAEELAKAQRRINSAVEQGIIARKEAKPLLKDLGTSNDQIARSTAEALGNVEDLRAQLTDLAGPQGRALAKARRTKEQFQRQAEALQNVNRILARRESGIQAEQVMPAGPGSLGEMPPVLQSIQDLSGQPNVLKQYAQRLREAKIQAQELAKILEDIELAGSSEERGAEGLAEDLDDAATSSSRIQTSLQSLAREKPLTALTSSVEELRSEFKLSKQQAEQLKDTVKSDLASAAGNVGADLVEAFKDGKAEAQELVGVFQSGVANVLERFGGPLGAFAAPIVRSFQHGGEVRGPGGPTDDQVPAMLSDQEFVMRAASAQVAPEALQAMNQDPALAGMVEQMFVGREPEEFASGTSASTLPAPAHYASARIRAQSANQQEQALNRIAERLDEMKVRGTLTGDMDEIRAGIERNAEFKGR